MPSTGLKTPVGLIIYNRPNMTEKVFRAIRRAKPIQLFVIADGPNADRPDDADKCAAAQAIVERVDWDCDVSTNYSAINLGCRERVSSGLDWIFEIVEEAIILEDDCVPHPTFFRFCEELLERYRNDDRIMTISGNSFQFGRESKAYSYYFSRYNHIWGWASWRRAWQFYDSTMQLWPQVGDSQWLQGILHDKKLVRYWAYIFQNAYDGFNTWDYQWTFACWIQGGLSIVPNSNLVSNIGFGPEATHTKSAESKFANMPVQAMHFPLFHPPDITRDRKADALTEKVVFSGNLDRLLASLALRRKHPSLSNVGPTST